MQTGTPSRPGTPESATLVVLRAYDNPTNPSGSSQTVGPGTAEDTRPLDSSSRSDLRLSAISCSSAVNLIPPHPDSGHHHRGEFKESPFRWNYPSLPDLPLDQQEIDSGDTAGKDKKHTMRMWEGWKVIICCSCKNHASSGHCLGSL